MLGTVLLSGCIGLVSGSWLVQEPAPRDKPVEVIATISDLADMAEAIGGEHVRVQTLVPPGSDPHALLPRASLLLKIQRADVLLLMGKDYEHAFLPALLEKASNPRLAVGAPGYVVAGRQVLALEVPETLDRGAGADLHPNGNPHFNTDPEQGRKMAAAVRDSLIAADPGRRDWYTQRWKAWNQQLLEQEHLWEAYLKPLRGKGIVSYHRSWSYFAHRFGLVLVGEVEPKPGLRPSAKHLANLATTMRRQQVKVLLMEPWYPRSDVEKLLKITGARLISLSTTSGTSPATAHYADWLASLVDQVGQAYGRPPLAEFARQQAATNNKEQ